MSRQIAVLLLESHAQARAITAAYLTGRGCTVFGAATLADALEQLRAHPDIQVFLVSHADGEAASIRQELRRTFGVERVVALLQVVRRPDLPRSSDAGGMAAAHEKFRQEQDQADSLVEAIQDAVSRTFEQISLREQILRNQALMRVIPDSMFVFDADGIYQEVHAPDPTILARPPHELIGKSIGEVMGPDVLERHRQQVQAARRAGDTETPRPYAFEAKIAGETRTFESILTRIDEERSLVIVRDVTSEHRYLAQQREQTRYQATVHAISRRFVQTSPETVDDDLLFAMRKLGKHLGVDWVTLGLASDDQASLRVTHHWRRNGPSFPPILEDSGPREIPMDVPVIVRAMQKKGYLEIQDTSRPPETIESFAGDLERYGVRSLVALPLVERQTTVGALTISCTRPSARVRARDITLIQVVSRLINDAVVAQRSYRRVQETTESFETLFGLSVEGLLLHRGGGILHVNDALLRMFGYERQDMLSQTLDSLIAPAYHDVVFRFTDAAPNQPDIVQGVHREGHTIWMELEYRSVALADGTADLIAFHDVTYHKDREEQIRKLLEEKEHLIRDIHHRLKNQMLSIESLLSLKARGKHASAPETVLQELKTHVHSMTLLYDRLYRSSEDSNTLSASEYLPSLIRDILELLSHQKRLLPDVQVSDVRLPVKTLSRIGMILNELISNTVKHAYPDDAGHNEPGHIGIHLERDGDDLLLRYSDDGQGIPDAAVSGESGGLGMDLIRAFAEELGGELQMAGSVDGTRVNIRLPLPAIR